MRYIVVRPNTPVEKIRDIIAKEGQSMFPVVSGENRFLGTILAKDLETYPDLKTAGDVLAKAITSGEVRIILAHDQDPLDEALATMDATGLPFVPVVTRDGHYIGTVDRWSRSS